MKILHKTINQLNNVYKSVLKTKLSKKVEKELNTIAYMIKEILNANYVIRKTGEKND